MEKDWFVSLGLCLFIVLILPYSIYFNGSAFVIDASLYHLGEGSYFPVLTIQQMGVFLLIFIVAFAPSTLFYYLQYHAPRDKPITKQFLVAFTFSYPMILYMFISLLILSSGSNYDLMSAASYAVVSSVWGFLILAVIPFLVRDVSRTDLPDDFTNTTQTIRYIGRISKYTIVVAFLGVSVYLLPLGVSTYTYAGYGQMIFFAAGTFLELDLGYSPAYFRYINFAPMYYPLAAIPTLLYLFFIQSIIKYFRGEGTRMRAIAIGLAAFFVTPFALSVVSIYGILSFPLPFTFIIGVAVLFGLPQLRSAEIIWDDSETTKQWFDSEGVTDGDRIKVPFTARLRSKLKSTSRTQDTHDWEHSEEDVFGNDAD